MSRPARLLHELAALLPVDDEFVARGDLEAGRLEADREPRAGAGGEGAGDEFATRRDGGILQMDGDVGHEHRADLLVGLKSGDLGAPEC